MNHRVSSSKSLPLRLSSCATLREAFCKNFSDSTKNIEAFQNDAVTNDFLFNLDRHRNQDTTGAILSTIDGIRKTPFSHYRRLSDETNLCCLT
jgi:hypothetical protein